MVAIDCSAGFGFPESQENCSSLFLIYFYSIACVFWQFSALVFHLHGCMVTAVKVGREGPDAPALQRKKLKFSCSFLGRQELYH